MTADATVIPLRRPPVRQSTMVRSDAGHTFFTFVRTIGSWWPIQPLSGGQDRVRDVTFEQRPGGRVYETWDDGTVVEWGTVTDWEPPAGFTMTWEMTSATTEVEFTFDALGPALTRVSVEHRGWEALSEEQLEAECRIPGGGYLGGSFDRGWELVLTRLAAAAQGVDPAGT